MNSRIDFTNDVVIKAIKVLIAKDFTSKQAEIYKLYRLDNLSQTEIANKLQLKQPTVSKHISSCDKKLKRFLDCLNTLLAM